jgi:4-amino-4-deoxy-L-arabinose transferase-like glycosyltransferase
VTEREWREASDMRNPVGVLALTVAIAAFLRFWTLGQGIPFAVGVDEPEIVVRVVGMMKTGDFNPHFFDYPGLYIYVQLVVACLRFLVGAMGGKWASLNQVGPADFYLWGRAVTAVLGTATVLLVYRIGMRWGSRHALLAAGLLAVMPNHVRESHFVLTDVPLTFFVTLTFLLALRAHEKGTLGAFAWAGAAAGMATATKYNGLPVLLLPLLAAHASKAGNERPLLRDLSAVGACAGVFLAAAPYTVLDLPAFLNAFAYLATAYRPRVAAGDPGWLIYLKHLRLGFGWPGLILTLSGAGLAAVRIFTGPGKPRFGMLLLFPAVYFYLIATKGLIFGRYLLPIVPFLCLLAGIAVVSGVSLLRRFSIPRAIRTALIAGLTVAALLPPMVTAIKFDLSRTKQTTYGQVYDWITKNVPPGSRVVIETAALRLPDEKYRVEQVKRLIDASYEAYVSRNTDYLIASSQAYGPAFQAPHEQAAAYAAYRTLFDQSEEVKRIPQLPSPALGPEWRIFRLRRQ